MRALTARGDLYLHFRIVEESGGSHGVRDIALLESATVRPYSGFAEVELFPTIFDKAASLTDGLVRNHPFVDGNKRTGIAVAILLLDMNGCQFAAEQEEVVEFAVTVAVEHPEISSIATWLTDHCVCE